MRFAVLSLAALAVPMMGLSACVGTPAIEKVAAAVEEAGACKKLPEGVTCDCVIQTAHETIPTITVDRNKDDTGSRLGRGSIGQVDERIAPAIEAAKAQCAAGKAVG